MSFLFGGLEHFLIFHILGIIIPADFHIFQRGRYTTNQYMWRFPKVGVLPNYSIYTGVSSINHPFSKGTPISGNPHMCTHIYTRIAS